MKLGLKFTKRLQDKDHWELLEKLSDKLSDCSSDIHEIGTTLDGYKIAPTRQELAKNLAKAEVYREIIRMKLCVDEAEWEKVTSEALEIVEKELFPEEKEEEDFDTMDF